MEWDTAAGDAVLRGAGGRMCGFADTRAPSPTAKPVSKTRSSIAAAPGVVPARLSLRALDHGGTLPLGFLLGQIPRKARTRARSPTRRRGGPSPRGKVRPRRFKVVFSRISILIFSCRSERGPAVDQRAHPANRAAHQVAGVLGDQCFQPPVQQCRFGQGCVSWAISVAAPGATRLPRPSVAPAPLPTGHRRPR